ncbi:MAG: helix-turn-helix domain-containing protein [Gammaproteobacteria bacterium]
MVDTDNSVFDDLGFDKNLSGNLQIRAALMRVIINYIREENITQTEAAERFGITQPRVSDLIRGKINLFTIDMLITVLSRVGFKVSLNVEHEQYGSQSIE